MTEFVDQMLLELFQAWCCAPFPGKLLPVPNHLLCENPPPNIQSELPLTQLHAIPWGPIAGHQGELVRTQPPPSPLPCKGSCKLQ